MVQTGSRVFRVQTVSRVFRVQTVSRKVRGAGAGLFGGCSLDCCFAGRMSAVSPLAPTSHVAFTAVGVFEPDNEWHSCVLGPCPSQGVNLNVDVYFLFMNYAGRGDLSLSLHSIAPSLSPPPSLYSSPHPPFLVSPLSVACLSVSLSSLISLLSSPNPTSQPSQ